MIPRAGDDLASADDVFSAGFEFNGRGDYLVQPKPVSVRNDGGRIIVDGAPRSHHGAPVFGSFPIDEARSRVVLLGMAGELTDRSRRALVDARVIAEAARQY
jgi:hypothetical protein